MNIFSKIREQIYKLRIQQGGVKLGTDIRYTYPFHKISKPHDVLELGNNILTSGDVKSITHDGASYMVRNIKSELRKFSKIRRVKVGDNVIISTKSLVTKDYDSNSVYAGISAKKKCSLNEYIEKYKIKYGREL